MENWKWSHKRKSPEWGILEIYKFVLFILESFFDIFGGFFYFFSWLFNTLAELEKILTPKKNQENNNDD